MPSAIHLYSLPAQLGRRGTTALVVIGLHVLMALGLITAMALRVGPKPPDTATPAPPPVQEADQAPIRTYVGGDYYVPLPPVSRIEIDPDDVVPPGPSVGPEALPLPQSPEAPALVRSVRVLSDPPPLYPAAERRLEHEGVVTVRVRVDAAGRAELVEVATSSGHQRLDRAAVDAVLRWTFAPAQTATGPISSWVTLTIRFRLNS